MPNDNPRPETTDPVADFLAVNKSDLAQTLMGSLCDGVNLGADMVAEIADKMEAGALPKLDGVAALRLAAAALREAGKTT